MKRSANRHAPYHKNFIADHFNSISMSVPGNFIGASGYRG